MTSAPRGSSPSPTRSRSPPEIGAAVARVWQLQPASDAEPDVVYAGVEPAALFRSDDGGVTFRLVEELWRHEHRPNWEPGGGGLCLHTILPDPTGGDQMAIAVSAAGFYRTLDGRAWESANTGIAAPFLPEPTPEFGQCVHKVDRHPTQPDTLFLQHHWGVYRSDDFGGTWQEIGADQLPSTFGFPIVVDPNRPGTAYVLPLDSDLFRCTPEGRVRVFRTVDGGATWRGWATACRNTTPGSRSYATASPLTRSSRRASTSARVPGRSSPRPTAATRGGRSPATSRRSRA